MYFPLSRKALKMVKLGVYAMPCFATGAHLPSHRPLSLWWIESITQRHRATVKSGLPQFTFPGFPQAHLLTNRWMKSCISYTFLQMWNTDLRVKSKSWLLIKSFGRAFFIRFLLPRKAKLSSPSRSLLLLSLSTADVSWYCSHSSRLSETHLSVCLFQAFTEKMTR